MSTTKNWVYIVVEENHIVGFFYSLKDARESLKEATWGHMVYILKVKSMGWTE